MKKTTIADVAKHANVSKSTVSQYLNQRYDYMGEQTKERIEKAIAELKYSPNILARGLKQKSSTTIGVIVANILHVFSTQVIRAIEDFCNEKDFHVIVCNADDDPVKEKRYIDMLRAKQVDGIIAFPTGENVELYKGIMEENYPVVFMDRLIPGITINTILLDNEQAAFLAVNEFVKKGHERIGVVSPPLTQKVTPRFERMEGYKKALEHHGIEFNPDYILSGEIEEMHTKLKKMMRLPVPPTAILAINDRTLIEILTYTKEEQVRIPEDLALINVDDVSFASIYNPALTTIAQPAFEMGKKAAEVLFDLIRDKGLSADVKVYRFKPELIVRESS
ncbi:LacI family DNA-binding transcriptional regulator [Oceanobacillus polygoni]|uniref:LacI family kdg operon repressor n=1 Tax=Oceanobacillus polygoni TaxID=1235259 RepID=A0A9X1CDD6_9BACI|nr:substrate-binding domain-containing protein [Oceanobacillus polygoni]MBP2076090.1 LacI family kdg operon repressor [Oceanobacillus polygoni]